VQERAPLRPGQVLLDERKHLAFLVRQVRGRIAQPGQVAAQRRVQGAHEADVGWCVRLTGAAAGSQPDRTADYQRRARY
jgi:hypothetical protein